MPNDIGNATSNNNGAGNDTAALEAEVRNAVEQSVAV